MINTKVLTILVKDKSILILIKRKLTTTVERMI